KKISKQKNVPPFVIFQDPSIEDMAIQYPVTTEELQNIAGVGVGKAQRYGKEFVDVIGRYVEEKDIVRPQDLIVKSVVNKSGLKVYIIKSIDNKRSLDDIADAKGIEMPELIGEIESIVNSGTRLNLSYYIDQLIDEDRQDDITAYFREEAETDSLDEALEELGDEYDEEEIRLVRIKFLSEFGN
ncbi:MAG TPA: HRDC domain-containing protein, partial [Bacteroidales bacterium]|nr:HRDC domain-containing protein [Bacteroidales bacterium]